MIAQSWAPTREEMLRALEPFVAEKFPPGDPRWAQLVETAAAAQRASRRRFWLGWLERFRRTQKGVEQGYTDYWGQTSIQSQLESRAKPVPVQWGQDGMLAYSQGPKRVQQLVLMRLLEALAPESVLEVGCGNGLNLLIFSCRLPKIRFSGGELTESGVAAAKKIQELDRLPDYIVKFSPEPLADLSAHKSVEFRQADALKLPYADGAFDTVFTSLALEQMEEIRRQALSEIARVAKRRVVLLEPFRDYNAEGLRRDYIVSMDYFAAWVDDLKEYGLEPVLRHGDLPCKLHLGVGVVVAEKRGR